MSHHSAPTEFARRYIQLCVQGWHDDPDVRTYLLEIAGKDLDTPPIDEPSEAMLREARLYVLQALASGKASDVKHVQALLGCHHAQAWQFVNQLKAEYEQAIQCPTFSI